MSYVLGMKCRECGNTLDIQPVHVCEECFGPLEVAYDYARLAQEISRERIEAGPRSLWRYRDMLPIEGEPATGLSSGWTPLRPAPRLAEAWGVRELWIKDDSVNHPTLSYKERVVSVAISKAVEFGFERVACASTGNLANSVSAHAAGLGIPAFVCIPHDLEQGKVLGSQIFAPAVVRVRGNYDDVNRLCAEIADRWRVAIVNVNMRPFYTEGAKTYGYEVAEQLGWRLPDAMVVPTAGGTLLPKIHKGFKELVQLGLVEDRPWRMYSAQAAGCDPVATAVRAGTDDIIPQKPNTIAKSIAIGNPADGYYVVKAVEESGGWAASVTDAEIVDGIKELARCEGIWTEPAGGTTVASTRKLIEQGRIDRDGCIVVSITGNGLKTQEAVVGHLGEPYLIDPKLSDFAEVMADIEGQAPAPVAQAV